MKLNRERHFRPKRATGEPSGTTRNVRLIAPVPLYYDDLESLAFFKSPWRAPIVVLVVALVARIAQFLLIWIGDPSFGYCMSGFDPYTYDTWAKEIIAGDWLAIKRPVFYMGPLYPYLIAVLYKIVGHSYTAAHCLSFILGLGGVILSYCAATQWFSRRVAFIAGLALALCPSWLFYESFLLPDPLTLLFLALFALVLGRIARHPDRFYLWAVAGMALAPAVIQRGNYLLCSATVAFWLAIGFRPWPLGRRIAAFAIFLLALFATISPVTLHNRIVGKKWVLVTSNGPIALYYGNGREANGIYTYGLATEAHNKAHAAIDQRLRKAREEARAARDASQPERAEELSRKVTALQKEYDGYYSKAMRKEILENPLRWLALMAVKAYLFWGVCDPPDNFSFALHKRFSPLERFSPFSYPLLVSLGFVGIALSRRRWRDLLGLHAFLFTMFVSVIIVFVSGRFRPPALIILSDFAALAVWKGWEWARNRQYRQLAMATAAAALILIALNLYHIIPFGIRWNDFAICARYYDSTNRTPQAVAILKDAERHFMSQRPRTKEQSIILENSLHLVRKHLAGIYYKQEAWGEHSDLFQTIVAAGIADNEDLEMAIQAYVAQGRLKDAVALADQVAANNPDNPRWKDLAAAARQRLARQGGK